MKKRILSCLMALALCLTLLPTAALADEPADPANGEAKQEQENQQENQQEQPTEEEMTSPMPLGTPAPTAEGTESSTSHTHCVCGAEHKNIGDQHTKVESTSFTEWTDALAKAQYNSDKKTASNSLPKEGGSYYLTTDVEIKTTWSPANNTALCLNGYSIKGGGSNGVIMVDKDVNFTLCDCSGSNKTYRFAGGTYGQPWTLDGSGNHEVTGGILTSSGSGVFIKNGTFNMYGGEITNNTAAKGGGVYLASGTPGNENKFNMCGGTISGTSGDDANTAKNTGGVCVGSGTFNMSGGSITNNTATDGGVFVTENSKFDMSSGSSITRNTAVSNGGGVYVRSGTFTVSGTPTVMENTRENAASNVWLGNSNVTITIGTGGLTDGASIGVTKDSKPGSVIADNVTKDYSDNFSSDNTNYQVAYENKQLVLAEKSQPPAGEHKHCLCGKTHTSIGDHENDTQITFDTKLWMDNGVLKKGNDAWKKGTVKRADGGADSGEGYVLTAGSYYLENDLTLKDAAILIDGDVKLCLNGHTIDRANGNAALDYVIWVLGENKAHLTLTDCVGGGTIKGGGNGGVDIFNSCTLDMFGGTITGNTNSGVDVGQFGEFNMYGGKITGNSAGYGGGVYTYGKFTMSGGSITNNTATEKGGGVLVGGGTFTVSGNVNITNNKVGETDNNVYLSEANKTVIGVTGALTGGARIGVTPETWPVGNGQRAIASGASAANGGTHYDMTRDDMNCFQSDNGEYQTSLANNTVLLAKKGGGTPEIVPVSQITLNKAETSISVGNSETLTATVAPENAANKRVTWTSSNENVATVDANGTVTAVKAGTATITATAADGSGKSATCTVTVTGGTTPSQPGGSTGGSSSGGGGGSSSDRDSSDSNPVIKTETKNNADGSTTKTETRRDGSVTQTTTAKDGSVSKTETKKDGSSVTENKAADGSTGTVKTNKNGQTEAKTALSNKAIEDAKKNGEAVKAPVEVEASRDSNTAPTVKVELPKGAGETKVEIPVSNVKPGTVAVLVHPDGTEEILKNSIPTEDGIQLTVDGNTTVKIVDNSKGFIDIRDHWAEDAIDFVSARGLVNGMTATIYAPNNSTTRAQLWTILARQNNAELTGGATWYEKAQNWAKDKGVSDGANPNAAINRAQMVTMLWRAVGQPTAGSTANFTDVPADTYYAGAVSWAVENGITTGVGGGRFDPAATCTRAQIAAFLTRLYAEK